MSKKMQNAEFGYTQECYKVENIKSDANSVRLLIKKLGFLYADLTDF